MDWEIEKAYSFDAGKKEGIKQGEQQKAVENALKFLAMNILTPKEIAQGTGLSLEKVLELQKQIPVKL